MRTTTLYFLHETVACRLVSTVFLAIAVAAGERAASAGDGRAGQEEEE